MVIIEMILDSSAKQGGGGPSAEFYAIVSALVVGVPSIIIALATFVVGSKARHIQEEAAHARVDADAYIRAKELYESMYNEMRSRIEDLHAEVKRLNEEIKRLKNELREAKRWNGGSYG